MNDNSLIRPLFVLFAVLTVITGVVYPLAVTGVAQVAFPHEAYGSIIHARGGRAIGSELIGQPFSDPKHFWSRPSATPPQPYNGTSSSGSNLGPTNPALADAIKGRVEALRAADPGDTAPVPIDLVTASGSGLDPHISVAAANYQVKRVAKARNMPIERVQAFVDGSIEGTALGFLGEPRVNVLRLNVALDAAR